MIIQRNATHIQYDTDNNNTYLRFTIEKKIKNKYIRNIDRQEQNDNMKPQTDHIYCWGFPLMAHQNMNTKLRFFIYMEFEIGKMHLKIGENTNYVFLNHVIRMNT